MTHTAVQYEHVNTGRLAVLILAIVLLAALTPALPRVPGRVAALVLAALGVLWLFVNKPMEGGTVLQFSAVHGLTDADMLSVAAFAVAAYTLVRDRR